MPTLRLSLFDKNFEVLDRTDIPVPGEERHGAGEAMKAAKQHLWDNHFSADLDPLLASRANLLNRLDDLIADVKKLQQMAKLVLESPLRSSPSAEAFVQPKEVMTRLLSTHLTEARSAVMESRMMDDAALPKKYREDLERRFGRKVDINGKKI